MTAPDRYDRLEALGQWRETPDAPPREVVVCLGRSTLQLKDLAETPLGHWALAGVVRLRRDGPAIVYSMTTDGTETLAIADGVMIEAIAAVARFLPAGARRRRLPLVPLAALLALAALGVGAARLLPGAAASILPEREAAALGQEIVARIASRGCADPGPAPPALAMLAERLAPKGPPAVRLLPMGAPAVLLPGGTLVVDAAFARSAPLDTIARAVATALATDPLATAFAAAGPVVDLRYLLTGRFDDAALDRAASALAPPLRGC